MDYTLYYINDVSQQCIVDTYHLSDKPSEDWEKPNKRIVRLAVSSEIVQRKMIKVTMGWVGLDWNGLTIVFTL